MMQKVLALLSRRAAAFASLASRTTWSKPAVSHAMLHTRTRTRGPERSRGVFCDGSNTCTRLVPHHPVLRRNAHVLVGSTEPILYKKCRFMGSLFAIDSPEDVEHALASLVASNSRVRKSTHPHMHAWVCGDRSGSHDCGESTAGRKILSVLEKSELGSNHQGQHRGGASGGYLVTVTRWYGGSHLGSARWRIIAASARAALQLLDEATPLATSSSSSSSGTTSDNPAAPGDHSHSGGTKRQRKRQRVRRKRKR